MIKSCIFCQKQLVPKINVVCSKCNNHLLEDEIEACDLDVFKSNGTEELYYYLLKIDTYFQSEICTDSSFSNNSASKEELAFHKQRINCLLACINQINPSVFKPKTEDEVKEFKEQVNLFWNNQLSIEQRDNYLKQFNIPSFYDNSEEDIIKSTFVNLMSDKVSLDWSWFQYMEIHFMDFYKCMPTEKTLIIVKQHFEKEIMHPIQLTD